MGAFSVSRRIAEVRERVAGWRRGGERVALVPTMGNLHAGHMALMEAARQRADRVVGSLFVNPLQFSPNEDLAAYPRTETEDCEKLAAAGVDLLFAPSETEMYGGRPRDQVTQVEVPGISEQLCGASRPGHFRGVATVVAKLFNIVQPDVALFGLKDYQQFLVLRRMVDELHFPVEMVGVPTVREGDGLAMSSRNGYLSAEERRRAPALFMALQDAAAQLAAGERDFARMEGRARGELVAAGMRPDYVAVRRADDLEAPEADGSGGFAVLGAAWLGRARLIDNVLVDGGEWPGHPGPC